MRIHQLFIGVCLPFTLAAETQRGVTLFRREDSSSETAATDSGDSSGSDEASSSQDSNSDESSSESSNSESESTESADSSSSDDSNESSTESGDKTDSDDSSSTQSSDDSSSTESSDDSSSTDSSDDSSSTESSDDSSSSESSSTSVSIDPNAPVGSLTFNTPQTTDSLYVKSGNMQTFEWGYTGVSVTPDALNIDAYCSDNKRTYTLAVNRSAEDTTFVWNSSDNSLNDGNSYPAAKYTLRIYNASADWDDQLQLAGLMAPGSITFGLYLSEAYSAWSGAATYINQASLHPPTLAATAAAFLVTCIAVLA